MRSRSPAAEAVGEVWELGRAALARDLAERAFGIGVPARPRRIGAEVELIPVEAATRRAVPVAAPEGLSLLPLLRRHAAGAGWTEARTPGGAPLFLVPRGGAFSFEPGGQLEFSSPACASVGELARSLRGAVLPLRAALEAEGVELLSVGVSPHQPVERVPLQLASERYAAMTAHFQRIGPAGARMMRQTASFQVNLDWEGEAPLRWRVLNALAPYLVAVFANSPLYEGRPTGARSFRARVWRELDPARTGLLGRSPDPAEEYLDFALGAPALLLGAGEPCVPFAHWTARPEVTAEDWWLHLTTLFPEVRPKGYAEVRSPDAVAPEWYPVPPTLLSGLLYHPASLAEARELLGEPDPELLVRAGECGLSDPRLAGGARALFQIALRGAAALGEGFVDGESLEVARDFLARYTARGRSPADDHPAAPAAAGWMG